MDIHKCQVTLDALTVMTSHGRNKEQERRKPNNKRMEKTKEKEITVQTEK